MAPSSSSETQKYQIKLVSKTINFLKRLISKKYQIIKWVKDKGIVRKITIGFFIVVIAFASRFGRFHFKQSQSMFQSLTPIEKVENQENFSSSSLFKGYKKFELSDSPSVRNLMKMTGGGDLGKSGPGPRARNDANRASKTQTGVAQAFPVGSTNSNKSRPAGANRAAQRFESGRIESTGGGLFGRSGARPSNPHNPGCAGGPRSVTVISGQKNSNSEVVPTQTQMSGFVKNGKVDLDKCLDEVNRRASEIGCTDFECSLERFKALATETGELTSGSAREAITILQGEMQGHYKNTRRVDYGPNVKGPDFAVDGLGEFEHITHAEAKNAVGSAIQIADGFDANIWKQGKNIGKKSVWQKKFWSDTSRTSEVLNLNSDAYLPKSANNTLTVVDCYDVPPSEKETISSAINFGAKNDTNLIILNNRTNI